MRGDTTCGAASVQTPRHCRWIPPTIADLTVGNYRNADLIAGS